MDIISMNKFNVNTAADVWPDIELNSSLLQLLLKEQPLDRDMITTMSALDQKCRSGKSMVVHRWERSTWFSDCSIRWSFWLSFTVRSTARKRSFLVFLMFPVFSSVYHTRDRLPCHIVVEELRAQNDDPNSGEGWARLGLLLRMLWVVNVQPSVQAGCQ